MNRITFTISLAIGIILMTFYTPWWFIVILCAVLSYFYKGNLLEKTAIVSSLTITIWLSIGGFHEMATVNKASHMIGQVFNNISPTLIYTITGIIISLPCTLATGIGHRLRSTT